MQRDYPVFFDYPCSAWYPSLQKDLWKRLQVSQNNFSKFSLQLEKGHG